MTGSGTTIFRSGFCSMMPSAVGRSVETATARPAFSAAVALV
jgi:hypothetical protein